MREIKVVIFILLLITSNFSWSDDSLFNSSDPQAILKAFRQQMLKHQKMMDKMFKSMEEDFFSTGLDDDFFNDPLFRGGLNYGGLGGSLGSSLSEWREDESGKTLVLKMKMDKDNPVDIEIKDGQIRVKADIKEEVVHKDPNSGVESKSISRRVVNLNFAVPSDCDQKSAEIKQVGDEVHIHFAKRKIAGGSKSPDSPTKLKSSRKPIEVEGETI